MAKKTKPVTKIEGEFPVKTSEVVTASGAVSAARAVNPEETKVNVSKDGTESTVRVLDAVTDYVMKDALEKSLKEEKEAAATVIRAFAQAVRRKNAQTGNYQKTLRVLGKKARKQQHAVDASDQDSFSVPKKKEDIDAIREALGKDTFDQMFEPTIKVSIKKEVMDSDALRRELSRVLFDALGTEGMKKFFKREETWQVKKGTAERIHTFDEKTRNTFREKVEQKADSLKDATEMIVD